MLCAGILALLRCFSKENGHAKPSHVKRRDQRPSYSGSYAMEAASTQHTCYYRSGYDISVGLWPKVTFHELQSIPPDHRRYFLTFRVSIIVHMNVCPDRGIVVLAFKTWKPDDGWAGRSNHPGIIVDKSHTMHQMCFSRGLATVLASYFRSPPGF